MRQSSATTCCLQHEFCLERSSQVKASVRSVPPVSGLEGGHGAAWATRGAWSRDQSCPAPPPERDRARGVPSLWRYLRGQLVVSRGQR
eukprot:6739823-Pyramimonas_sp.AAC.1